MTSFLSAALFDRDGSTLLSRLDTSFGRQWLDEREGDGSFGFSIPVEDATQLATGRIVKFSWGTTSTSWVFAGVIEAVTINKTGGGTQGEDRVADVSGRGVRCLLENALVYPVGTSDTRTFSGQKAGAIMETLFDEAQARGVLVELSTDFNSVTDSKGQAFTRTLTLSESAGTNLSEVAARHQELAVDIHVTPELVLQYFNTRGEDLTLTAPPVSLRVGESVGELTTEKAGPVRNTVLVGYGSNKYETRTDNTSVSSYGRRETFLNVSGTTSLSHAQLAGDQVLSVSAVPSDGITVQLDASGPQPYVNFNVCDYLWVIDHTGARSKYRVASISASEADDGSVSFVPELGTLRADLTRRLNRALSRLEAKNGNGTSTSGTDGNAVAGTQTIVVLPDGLLLPAVINGAAGYPFRIPSQHTLNFVPQTQGWAVMDLTSLGFYTRTLITYANSINSGTYRTLFVNLDDITKYTFFSDNPPHATDKDGQRYTLIQGQLYQFDDFGIYVWSGTEWVRVFRLGSSITGNSAAIRVGTTWYLWGGRFASDGGSDTHTNQLYTFDETTGVFTKRYTTTGTGYEGFYVKLFAVGYGRIYVGLATVGGLAIFTATVADPTTFSLVTTTVNGDSLFTNDCSVLFDGRLQVLRPTLGVAINLEVLAISPSGQVDVQTNAIQPVLDLQAGGATVYNIAQMQYPYEQFNQGGTLASPTGWVLVTTLYGVGTPSLENPPTDFWRIDAVNFYGSTLVAEGPLGDIQGSGAYGPTGLHWVPGQEDEALRFSIRQDAYEYSVGTLPPPIP